jgi:hypothetical protein
MKNRQVKDRDSDDENEIKESSMQMMPVLTKSEIEAE